MDWIFHSIHFLFSVLLCSNAVLLTNISCFEFQCAHDFGLKRDKLIIPLVFQSQSSGSYDIIFVQLSVSFIQDGQVELEIFLQLLVVFSDKESIAKQLIVCHCAQTKTGPHVNAVFWKTWPKRTPDVANHRPLGDVTLSGATDDKLALPKYINKSDSIYKTFQFIGKAGCITCMKSLDHSWIYLIHTVR